MELAYARKVLISIPCTHWVFMGVLALIVFLLTWKKSSVYGAIMMGFTVIMGVFLLDAVVLLRLFDILPYEFGTNYRVGLDRLFPGTIYSRTETLSNIAAFTPFGLFLSEFLASARRFSAGRRLGLATLAGFGLSLCIECLQLMLRVGFFELTDLVMNTLGAFVGAGVSVGVRKVVGERYWTF